MNKLLYLLVLLIVSSFSYSQSINVTQTRTVADLVQNVLAGQGVTITNIKYNGNAAQALNVKKNVSYFDKNGITAFPISSGMLLSTGDGSVAIGPNNSTSSSNPTGTSPVLDADLNTIASGTVRNGVVLEFDLIPTGDSISFNYFFASEEYPEFSPSSYNDAFGFFLSGPGINGPYTNNGINIAQLPSPPAPANTAVTINNVNPTTNSSFYVDNGVSTNPLYNAMQYDGRTVLLTASAHVQCNQVYHLKLAIANVSDQAYDSGVFLEANSLKSNFVGVNITTVNGDNTIIEGCTDATIIFTRPISQIDSALTINYTLGGNAVSGVNYQPIPSVIAFNPGEDSISIPLIPIDDGVITGPDSLVISIIMVNDCGDTIVSTGTIYILDASRLTITTQDQTLYCVTDSVLLYANATTNGLTPITYSWSNGMTGDSNVTNTTLTGPFEYIVTATDACGFSIKDTIHIDLQQTLKIDSLSSLPTKLCKNTGAIISYTSGTTGTPTYTWLAPDSSFLSNSSSVPNVGSGWYYFSIKDNVCKVSDSVFVDVDKAPQAIINPDKTQGCSPTTFTLSNGSKNAGKFQWNTGQGFYTVNDMSSQTVTLSQDDSITLIATDVNGECSDTTTISLTIVICGCTSDKAINYNPTAVIDDGSCIFEPPVVEFPNTFTPNGDGINDLYKIINMTNATKLEYWIFNRWGNLMFHSVVDKGDDFVQIDDMKYWDGKENGKAVADGIYFLKYEAKGTVKSISGQTFLHLLR